MYAVGTNVLSGSGNSAQDRLLCRGRNSTGFNMMSSTERLIEIVKSHPILYDLEHPDYKDKRKKDGIWDEIGAELELNGDAVKKRWKNLRDSYAKYLRGTKTTDPSAKGKYNHWQWAKTMEAFKPFLPFAKTESNITDLIMDGSDLQNKSKNRMKLPQSNKDFESQNTQQRRKNKEAFDKRSLSPSVDKVIEYLHNKRRHTDMEGIELIFLGYAKTVKSFSPKRQAITKLKIAQIIMEQELEHHEEILMGSSNTPRPSSVGGLISPNNWSSESGTSLPSEGNQPNVSLQSKLED